MEVMNGVCICNTVQSCYALVGGAPEVYGSRPMCVCGEGHTCVYLSVCMSFVPVSLQLLKTKC